MVRVVALYKRPADPAAFERYYFTTHKPIAEKIPGLIEYRCSKVFGGPMGRSPWYFMAELCFKDKEAFKAGMSSPESAATAKDLDNFAKDICEVLFIDEAGTPVTP